MPCEDHLLGQFIPLHYHYNMLQDESRVSAFRAAIEHCVRPGMRVVELGGGTGILSFFAAQQGAKVWCVERNGELVEAASRLLLQNGVGDRVEVVHASADEYVPPEPIDVVVCEMLHVALLREKQTAVIDAFKRNYQAAYGEKLPRMIPDSSILMMQPLEHAFDFGGYVAPLPLFQAPAPEHPNTTPLANFTPYGEVYYDQPFAQEFGFDGQLGIEHQGIVTAMRFVTQNLLAYTPDGKTIISWPNQLLVLPIENAHEVYPGDTLAVRFGYSAGAPLTELSDSLDVSVATYAVRSNEQLRAAA